MLNVSLTKAEEKTQGILLSVPQNYPKMTKINEG